MCFLILGKWIKSSITTIQMKPVEQYVSVVLFMMLYQFVTSESAGETVKCDSSNESY